MPKKPSHRLYVVTKAGDRNFQTEISAAWPHIDNESFSLKLTLLPLNGAEIVLRVLRDSKESGEA